MVELLSIHTLRGCHDAPDVRWECASYIISHRGNRYILVKISYHRRNDSTQFDKPYGRAEWFAHLVLLAPGAGMRLGTGNGRYSEWVRIDRPTGDCRAGLRWPTESG